MTRLNVISATAEDSSVTNAESPRVRMSKTEEKETFLLMKTKLFFLLKKWNERIPMLMIGARPVAKAAPNIPISSGKMNM